MPLRVLRVTVSAPVDRADRQTHLSVCISDAGGACARTERTRTRAARAVRALTVRVRAHVRARAVCFRPRCGRGRCVPLGVRCRTRQFGS